MSNASERKQTKKIAILGAGIAGMALAAILSRNVKHSEIIVYERDHKDKDQGTGFDIDGPGQKVLQKAGVYDTYWDYSRKGSDIAKIYCATDDEPTIVITPPRILQPFRKSSPESNRQLLRNALLNAIIPENCTVHFECPVNDIRQKGKQAELIGENEKSLGVYDLVVDASGVSSHLRKFRIKTKETKEDYYTGVSMFHGIIIDPDANCDPKLVKKLGQGTMVAANGGRLLFMQRYGAHKDDHRTSVYYMLPGVKSVGGLSEIVQAPKAAGFIDDEEILGRIRAWIHADMKDLFDATHHDLIDKLDSVMLRPLLQHPSNPEFHDDELPLILIGDALHALPPYTGAGGNFALDDANDLSDFLQRNELNWQLGDIRKLENQFLKRTSGKMKQGNETKEKLKHFKQVYDDTRSLTKSQVLSGHYFIYFILLVGTWIYYVERFLHIRND